MNARAVLTAALLVLSTAGCSAQAAEESPAAPPTSAAASSSPSAAVLRDGRYTVGQDIEPGTYVAQPVSSCFWARYDSSGETIDNDFTQATRVQVEIEPLDYSFSSEGCGGWTRDTSAEDAAAENPTSPEASNTGCAEYSYEMDWAEREGLVAGYLANLRERDKKSSPSEKLVVRFAKRVNEVCSAAVDRRSDTTAGTASLVIYENESEFSR